MNLLSRKYAVVVLALIVALLAPSARACDECRGNYRGLSPLEWSVAMADSEMARSGDKRAWRPGRKAKWDYTSGLFTLALLKLNQHVPDAQFVEYAKDNIGSFITEDGNIQGYKMADYNIDNIAPGKTVIALYELTQEPRYKKCAELLRKQLDQHPRTSEGGFWHKQRYPWQMWLDGLFMGAPFYAEYAKLYDPARAAATYDDVAKQFRLINAHLYDAKSGLSFHGWDEKREQDWANPATGTSSNFWGRGLGWFAMACVDTLDFLPKDHPGRPEIIATLKQVCDGVVKWQDKESGLWWQVLDQGGREKNYLEATAACMFVYAMAKGVNENYLAAAPYHAAIEKGYAGIIHRLMKRDERGEVSLTQCCSVAGLGYGRDGSYDYYMREPVIDNDLKGVGPFILAGIEMQKLQKLPLKIETRARDSVSAPGKASAAPEWGLRPAAVLQFAQRAWFYHGLIRFECGINTRFLSY